MGKWILLEVGSDENSLLDGEPKCQGVWLMLDHVCHGFDRGPVDVRPRSQGLAGVSNAVWMLKKSGSMFERRCDFGDKGGLALSIKVGLKKGL
mgnify:FL=1